MIFDIIVIAVLLISAGIAFFRGVVREVLTILGVVGGSLAAIYGSPHLSPMLLNMLGGESGGKIFGIIPVSILAPAIAYISLFFIVVIILSFLSHMISKAVDAVGMGPIDRTLGVIFGVLRGFLLLAILYMPFYILADAPARDDWFGGSKTRLYVESSSKLILDALPKSTKTNITEKADEQIKKTTKTIGEKAREQMKNLNLLTDKDNQNTDAESGATTGYEEEDIEALDAIIREQFQSNDNSELNE